MIKVTFDGPNKLILVADLVDDIDFKTDIYSSWKNWSILSDNLKYPQAIRTVGGDPLIGPNSLGITYFLENGWRIQPFSRNHTLNISGNIYTTEGVTPFVPVVGNFSVSIIMTVSNLSDATVLESEISQNLDYGGIVYLDTNALSTGVIYPYGTLSKPVNNLSDAISVCERIGVKQIYIKSNLDIDVSLSDYIFSGNNKSTVRLMNVDANLCTFNSLIVTGQYTGSIYCNQCNIENIINLAGSFSYCSISGYNYMTDDDATFHLCYSKSLYQAYPVLDYSNATLTTTDAYAFSGKLKIVGISVSDVNVNLEYISGKVLLDSTNTSGNITLGGELLLENNSTSMVDSSGVLNQHVISDHVWSTDTSEFEMKPNSFGYYIKNKILSTKKFLGLS